MTLPDKFKNFLNGIDFGRDDIFTKRLSELNANRLDPYYYSPRFDRIKNELSSSQYPMLRLKDICESKGIFAGKTPNKSQYSSDALHPKIVKVSSLKNGKVVLNMLHHFLPETFGDGATNNIIEDGDIFLLSAAHQSDYIGKNPCIASLPIPQDQDEQEEIRFVAELICIRVDKEIVNPYYLLQLLSTYTYYLLINREKRGQTSHIYAKDIKGIEIPVPDLSIQNKCAEKYKSYYIEYERHINLAEETLETANSEFLNLFDGEIS